MIKIDQKLLKSLRGKAKHSENLRTVFKFHQYKDPVQRMINAITIDSYVRPHRHQNPNKVEAFVILSGKILFLEFDQNGKVTDHAILEPEGEIVGVEILPGRYHATFNLDPKTVLYEIIEGPYNPKTHKKFAPWAPSDNKDGISYMRQIYKSLYAGK